MISQPRAMRQLLKVPLNLSENEGHVVDDVVSEFFVDPEGYPLGMCVLLAVGQRGTAAMFAKVLRHMGTPREKILESVARMSMWVGGLAATESTFVIQKALQEYDERGRDSLATWFPQPEGTPK